MPPSNEPIPVQLQQTTVSPQSSASPLISSDQRQQSAAEDGTQFDGSTDTKGGKRRLLFGLGKKKDEKEAQAEAGSDLDTAATTDSSIPSDPSQRQVSAGDLKPIAVSPRFPASPSRLRSSSPRLNSPASSEIFERSVQEPVPISTLGGELSPAHIPSHVMTEDHIPPALEASAQAITSESLNPDEVEIVTSTSHLPAAASVLDGSASQADVSSLGTSTHLQRPEELEPAVNHPEEESGNNYGSLDPNDVRRLSFISFADVVQSEHQHAAGPPASALSEIGSLDSLHIGSLPGSFPSSSAVAASSSSSPPLPGHDGAASPGRSPRSPAGSTRHVHSGGVTTPPSSFPSSLAARTTLSAEQSPVRSLGVTSNAGGVGNTHGELTIETMRQAVRKTASGDLGQGQSQGQSLRSPAMSPMSSNDESYASRSRTNT